GGIRREVEAARRGVDGEEGDRILRPVRMLLQQEVRRTPARGLEAVAGGERNRSPEVRPAVPRTRLDAPEQVARTPYGAAAADVELILRHEELALRRPGEPERVAESPRDQLRISAFRGDAEHGARAGDLARDDLPGLCGRSEEHTSELQSRENLVCRL